MNYKSLLITLLVTIVAIQLNERVVEPMLLNKTV